MTVNLVSIIIPSRSKDDISGLLADISGQKTAFKTEVIKITEVSPPGKARNIGALQAKGEALAFIDSDIRLGSDLCLGNLVAVLEKEPKIGAVCASLRLPPQTSAFQKRYAREIAHSETPVVESMTDVYVVPSACFAIRKELFIKLGGFNEEMIRGEDSELTERLRKAGYRTVLAPQTWCFHPCPDNFWQLARTNLRNGAGVSFVDAWYPQLNSDVHPAGVLYFSSKKTIRERIRRFIFTSWQAVWKGKILLLPAKVFYVIGYFYGCIKYRILKYNK